MARGAPWFRPSAPRPNQLRIYTHPASHCDIAWAGALASHAHTENKDSVGAAILMDDGTMMTGEELVARDKARAKLSPEERLLWSNDPRIWRPL